MKGGFILGCFVSAVRAMEPWFNPRVQMPKLQEPLEAREANFKYEQLIGSSGNGRRTMDDIKPSKVETFDSTGPWRHSRSNPRIDRLFSA